MRHTGFGSAAALFLAFTGPAIAVDHLTAEQLKAALNAASMGRLDFSGRDMRGDDLTGLDFHGAKLAHADLSGANLYVVKLAGRDLTGADLAKADLSSRG